MGWYSQSGSPLTAWNSGPLDGPDPSVGGDHRAPSEHRQAGHQHHDITPNTTHDLSPPPAIAIFRETTSQRGSSHPSRSRVGRAGWRTRPMAVEPHDTMSHESILIGRLASGSCAFVKSVYVCLRLRVSSWSWPCRPAAWH